MRVLDLFSGIGGFSLGLERAGMTTVAFCEQDVFCQAVLKKHWPEVKLYDDVKTLTKSKLDADGIAVDVICGGFPCQDISIAGKGAGLAGERSGLWYEFHRLIKEIRPQYAIIENVSALRSKGLDEVLRGLAALGYDAEWHCIPAAAVGAPHRRDRVWIVAYSNSGMASDGRQCADPAGKSIGGGDDGSGSDGDARQIAVSSAGAHTRDVADATVVQQHGGDVDAETCGSSEPEPRNDSCKNDFLADANEPRLEGWLRRVLQECAGKFPAGASGSRRVAEFWRVEPDVGRVADGVPARAHRLKALGNAVVPQIPEIIGKAIMHYEHTLVRF